MSTEKIKNNIFLVVLALFFVTGATLRLWNWSSQILLDDEWHALKFVVDKSFPEIFFVHGMGANSIPVNVYTWLLLHTVGWSEPLLHLPSLSAGIASLVIIPLLVRRLWSENEALIVAALLAISPVAVFYSRIARPYMPAMLLASTSVLLLISWLKEGRCKDIFFSSVCGALAIYYHLYMVIPVGIPFVIALIAVLPVGRRLGLQVASSHSRREFLLAAAVMAIIVGIFVVVPNLLNPWWSHGIHGIDRADIQTATRVLSLVAGTHQPLLMGMVLLLLLAGLGTLLQYSRTVGLMLFVPGMFFWLIMAITTQDGAHAGIQVVRYGIAFLPLTFLAIAVALTRFGNFLHSRITGWQPAYLLVPMAVALLVPFVVYSPLWKTYRLPNNFTNHSAYQDNYEPGDWLQASPRRDLFLDISVQYADIPALYLDAAILKDAEGIIEYPMYLGDHINIYYYYQYFHRLPVVAGYLSDGQIDEEYFVRDYFIAGDTIDLLMDGLSDDYFARSRWRTMVNLLDEPLLKNRYHGWLIVVHRNLLEEIAAGGKSDHPGSLKIVKELPNLFGAPLVFNDEIGVWRIR